MNTQAAGLGLEIFSTCPQSSAVTREDYIKSVIDAAHWSEAIGCKGILVYTDNSLVDPWLVAQIILQNTQRLCPLVAVQPIYMHPYTVAKMIASYAHFYQRQICLNMVAGGFKNDLLALNDTTPHDKRYARLVEYTTIIKQLLASPEPASFEGEFYRISNLRMTPPLPAELQPQILMSGSSEAGLAAARAIDALAVCYPKPAHEYEADPMKNKLDSSGVRVGIIAREQEDRAWEIAHGRFPPDRKGQLTHQMAMKTSDSAWHHQLSALAQELKSQRSVYWLHPFENYQTFCPYLVGDYDQVAGELARYIALGYRTFITDIPPDKEELEHTGIVFERARQWVEAGKLPSAAA
jgi:alkanesulfonate monooxygenase